MKARNRQNIGKPFILVTSDGLEKIKDHDLSNINDRSVAYSRQKWMEASPEAQQKRNLRYLIELSNWRSQSISKNSVLSSGQSFTDSRTDLNITRKKSIIKSNITNTTPNAANDIARDEIINLQQDATSIFSGLDKPKKNIYQFRNSIVKLANPDLVINNLLDKGGKPSNFLKGNLRMMFNTVESEPAEKLNLDKLDLEEDYLQLKSKIDGQQYYLKNKLDHSMKEIRDFKSIVKGNRSMNRFFDFLSEAHPRNKNKRKNYSHLSAVWVNDFDLKQVDIQESDLQKSLQTRLMKTGKELWKINRLLSIVKHKKDRNKLSVSLPTKAREGSIIPNWVKNFEKLDTEAENRMMSEKKNEIYSRIDKIDNPKHRHTKSKILKNHLKKREEDYLLQNTKKKVFLQLPKIIKKVGFNPSDIFNKTVQVQ